MSDQLNTILALWGAALSTILAMKVIWSFARDVPRLNVDAALVYISCNETDVTKGTKIQDKKGLWSQVLLRIRVSNSGSKSLQLVSIYMEEETSSHQVFPENIPIVLEPRTQVETTIQKEWLDNTQVQEFGVLDALGKRHPIEHQLLVELIRASNELASNKDKYRHKETGEIVEAFQVKDRSSINSKLTP